MCEEKQETEPEPEAEPEPGYRAAQLLSSIDGGDVLPEAEIVSNIVEKLERNLVTASCLIQFFNNQSDENLEHFLLDKSHQQSPSLVSALALFSKLYGYLKRMEDGLGDDKYDGDEDIEDQDLQTKKRKKKAVGGKSKTSHSIKLKGDQSGTKTSKLQYLVRDVIFYIVQDYGPHLSSLLSEADKDAGMTGFNQTYVTFKQTARPLVSRSRDVSVAEQKMLLEKIHNRHKMERVREKLRAEVELLEAAQLNMVKEKEKEGAELRLNIEESVEESREKIEEIMRNTQNNIKKMEWESNKRQVEMKDKILVLVGKKKELCVNHWAEERESRLKNLQLEAEVKALLDKYDLEMFDLHRKIQELETKYSKEKEELDKVEARLAIIDAEKQIILAEQRAEEARIRNAKLEDIRQRRAAITLQRAWRQYKVLQQQSKKKKKGKKK